MRIVSLISACVVALAVAAAPGTGRAESLSELEARAEAVALAALNAGGQLAGGNRAAAVGQLQFSLDEVADLIDAAEASHPELGKSRAKFERLLISLRKKFRSAFDATNNAAVQPWQAQRRIAAAQNVALAAQTLLQRTDARGVTLEELNARSAGFHGPQKTVAFKIRMGRDDLGGPCTEEPVIQVIDTSGAGALLPGFITLRQDAQGNRVIEVATGTASGGGRVEVSACGVTRHWLLFNEGPRNAYPTLPKPTVARFDGTYTGGYSGRAYLDSGGSQAVAGGVSFVIAGGRISIDAPGSGTGSIGATGKARFVGGSGGVGGASYRFGGGLTEYVVGGAGGGGSWTSNFQGGRASGTWSATRD